MEATRAIIVQGCAEIGRLEDAECAHQNKADDGPHSDGDTGQACGEPSCDHDRKDDKAELLIAAHGSELLELFLYKALGKRLAVLGLVQKADEEEAADSENKQERPEELEPGPEVEQGKSLVIEVCHHGADINAAGEEEVAEDTGGPIGGKEQAGRALAVLLKAKGIRSGDGERGHKSCLCGDGRHHGADDNAGSVEREHLTGVCSGENLHDNISYSLEHAGFAQHCADTECADEEPCGRTGKG